MMAIKIHLYQQHRHTHVVHSQAIRRGRRVRQNEATVSRLSFRPIQITACIMKIREVGNRIPTSYPFLLIFFSFFTSRLTTCYVDFGEN